MKIYLQAFKIYFPPLLVIVRESNGKYVFLYINFPTSNFVTLRNDKVDDKKFKRF